MASEKDYKNLTKEILEEVLNFEEKTRTYLFKRYKRLERIRKRLEIKRAEEKPAESYGAVDSAMKEVNYANRSLYIASVLAFDKNFIECDKAIIEDRPGKEGLLKSIAMMKEVILASKIEREIVFMDGSVLTFITAMNYGWEKAKKNKGKLEKRVKELYPKTVEKFTKMLKEKQVVFLPKRSFRGELAEEIRENASEWFIAESLLKEREYIITPFKERYLRKLRLEQAEKLIEIVREFKVLYFKGPDGNVYKAEGLSFPVENLMYFAKGGKRRQLIPMEYCDRFAKDSISYALKNFERRSVPWWIPIE